jgi:hypothetical protein
MQKSLRCLARGFAIALGCLLLPGSAIVVCGAASPPSIEVRHTPEQPRGNEPVRITVRTAAAPALQSVTLQVQWVDPGKYIALSDAQYKNNWVSIEMNAAGKNGDAVAGENIYSAEIAGTQQIHRRLVRYRITAVSADGKKQTAPRADDPEPNFAYFVYDGVPGWNGAIDPKSGDPKKRAPIPFSPEVMRRVQAYHLIAKSTAVEKATWFDQSRGKDYPYTGTLVFGGKVYDHVRFRARGGIWRYAMGKNMWKIDFNRGHYLEARDDYGRPYGTRWAKLNLRSCIQQGDYGYRGEQGMFEAVGFRLFNLAGVEAPHTHWVQLRIIDEAVESPPDQYRGDFWGLYLALENEDGQFLKEHRLPDGNLYKMMMGNGELSHQGANAVTNGSDVRQFMMGYQRGNASDTWWRNNVDLPRYYSYRSIIEAIHHYDVQDGKNYDYYFNPVTAKWLVIPWDIDLTWADTMYGGGNEPFKRPVLSRPVFNLEYQNRLREIRDLLFNTDQTYQLIDECAAFISSPPGKPSLVDADRAKWDYHPIMVSRYVLPQKAGQGLFYQAVPSRDFAGMVRWMKNYVKLRAAYIDRVLLNDPNIPTTPTLPVIAGAQVPVNRLIFRAAGYPDSTPVAATKWRLGGITDSKAPAYKPGEPIRYEITPVWESQELAGFQRDVTVPPDRAKAGHAYRLRLRVKDSAGRWSHWSEPIQFIATQPELEK